MTALLVGSLLAMTALCLGWRQILLGDQAINYPKAPFLTRLIMFGLVVALSWRSLDILEAVRVGQAPVFEAPSMLVSVLLCAWQAAELATILRSWLPARRWAIIYRWIDMASCGRMKILARRRAIDAAAVNPEIIVLIPPASVVPDALEELTSKMPGTTIIGPDEPFPA